ncbi:DUF2244 domain-containing protein [Noviherbaspirillum sp. ST9]|uniref:DUF2244 domain-containing protein n=1 Tax=Noviherbaspirillum sp. ST9 TaxID=3401606 RepID=UPI003B589499
MDTREWMLKRNCSLSPRQLGLAYLAVCTTSMLVATFFAASGAWYVLGFALVEQFAVGIAFLLYARHATDREHIALEENCLLVEVIQVEHVRQFRLDPRHTRVEPPESGSCGLVRLEANGTKVEIGRFLTEWKRRELARELNCALALQRYKQNSNFGF